MASTILNAAVTLGASSVALVTCPAGSQVAITDLMVVNGAAATRTFNLSLYRQATGQVYGIGPANRALASGAEPYRYPGKIFLSPGDELRAAADQAGSLVASAMYAVSASVMPLARGLAGKGTYSAAATYATNDIVDDGTNSYISLQDGNKGNTPAAGSSWWMVLARRGLPGADSTVPGPAGPPPTLSKGTATTGAAGSSMDFTLTATGTGSYRLDLTLPRGDPGAGSGDLVGPSASSDGEVMLFSGATGKLAKRSNTVAGTFGLSLLASATQGAAQLALGVRPGTDVQAFSANLAALAGLTGAADKLPYFTGAGALSLADFSSFSRSLTAQATAAAWRTALGLGTASTRDAGTAAGNLPILDTNGYLTAAVQPQITGGDVTAAAGSAVHSLTATGVAAGPYVLSTITLDAKGRATAASQGALTGDVTTAAGSLATTIANGVVTYAKMAAAALASASDLWSNAASKLVSVASMWAAEAPVVLGSVSGTVTLDFNALRRATATASASITLANPTNPKPGQTGSALITMGAANLTISYGSAWKAYGGTTPTAPTASGALCLLSWEVYASGTIVYSLAAVGA